jgi:hypothetical protein
LIKIPVNHHQAANWYDIKWDGMDENGKQVSSGIYFLQIQSGKFTAHEKMLLLRLYLKNQLFTYQS